ncbi:zinc-ribbon domain-containing protein [Desulfovermiculus halophilus]|uniref:zinc-ribbon domain-containing protein n=1 Tax=Desulfovermiculus halophilus TaxID=339722 RepID=UPI000484F7FC|nr:zinc-ribbon domain-containing protein [Desulfovermiculus halophilus]
MRLRCEHCQRSFDLPEEKVPQTSRFRFTCPACKEVNRIDLSNARDEQAEKDYDQAEAVEVSPVQVPPGTRLVLLLVADPGLREAVRSSFRSGGWEVIEVEDGPTGQAYLRSNRFHWVVVEDCPAGREVLAEVHRLPGHERREMNCVLIGDKAASFDRIAAFVAGVNCYLHPEHPSGLEQALEQAGEAFERHQRLWSSY